MEKKGIAEPMWEFATNTFTNYDDEKVSEEGRGVLFILIWTGYDSIKSFCWFFFTPSDRAYWGTQSSTIKLIRLIIRGVYVRVHSLCLVKTLSC